MMKRRESTMATVHAWRVAEPQANSDPARRIPPWKMTETEASHWASRCGVELEKVEGTQETFRPLSAEDRDTGAMTGHPPDDVFLGRMDLLEDDVPPRS